MRNLAILVAETLCIVLLVCLPPSLTQEKNESLKLIEVRRIWDEAPHNAFTDLIRFHDRWFCVFREAQNHESPDGAVRVISSADGAIWEPHTLIRLTPESFSELRPTVLPQGSYMDLRDPKLCIDPDGRLMLTSALVYNDGNNLQSLAWFSKDGRTWGKAVLIGEHHFWLWRVTWHKGNAYGVGRNQYERIPRLYRSTDDNQFEVLVKNEDFFPLIPGPSEATLRFLADDTAICLLRLNDMPGSKTNHAHLGMAHPPYTRWEWKDLGVKIGGPNMIQLPDGGFIAGFRLYGKEVRTTLCLLDPNVGTLTEYLTLPSGGDTSYPGLVLYDDLLWISYYSSHEGKTSIYLAKVKIEK